MMTERVPLFSNITEYDDWVSNNCKKCSKHRPEAEEEQEFICDIDRAIHLDAVWNDGCVDKEVADRMGWQQFPHCLEMSNPTTAYRLPLDKLQFLANLPSTHPDSDVFQSEVMEKNLELLAGCSPEFILGFASAIDCVLGSWKNLSSLSHTADVPMHYFEKIMLTIAVAAAQKYLKEKES